MYVEYVPGEKHAARNAARSENPDSFTDAGYELSDQNIVVDIDHLPKESIHALINEFGIKTMTVWTDRGAHLWFLKPDWFTKRKDGICRLGFDIEQHNKSDRPSGMTIKRNGVMREVENKDVFQYLPDIFAVETGKKAYESLLGLHDGEGRNKKLFIHRKRIERFPAWKKEIKFINQYVFAEPLTDSELSGIMRDLPMDEQEDQAENALASIIMAERSVVSYSGSLWWRNNDGHYVSDSGNQRLIRIIYEKASDKNTRYVDEVIKQMAYKAPYREPGEVFPIVLKNGIVKNGKFMECGDYRGFSPYYIDISYDPEAAPVEAVDEYLDQLTGGDKAYRAELEEVMGFVMITDPSKVRAIGKFFMFRGDGRNGKGTFLQILKRIYGEQNCTSLSIKQMSDERYRVTMIGKLVNLGDDIEDEAINNDQLKILKNITTADTFETRHLYKESEPATFTIKLIFTTNSSNKSYEKGYAFERRVKWMPMFNKIAKVDPNFIEKLTTPEALQYWMRLIIGGYKRLCTTGEWTKSEAVDRFNAQYHEENNPAAAFVTELDSHDFEGKTIGEVKTMYLKWAGDPEAKFPRKEIKKALEEKFGYITKCLRRDDNEVVRGFVRDSVTKS